jgi:thymidylate synthase (FAD)
MIKVLDHGFIKIRNISGPTRRSDREFDADDIDPANTARMSFDQMDEGRTREDDLKLADYLIRNWHTSPFEMIEIWVEMKLPIFVARQINRHRTSSLNEVSGRYTVLPNEFYVPDIVRGNGSSNKQGSVDNLDDDLQEGFRNDLKAQCGRSYELYEYWMNQGVAPEVARMFLHLNHYTYFVWKQDLHNMMHLMALRIDRHAQLEAQQYGNALYEALKAHLPESMRLFDKYRRFNHAS